MHALHALRAVQKSLTSLRSLFPFGPNPAELAIATSRFSFLLASSTSSDLHYVELVGQPLHLVEVFLLRFLSLIELETLVRIFVLLVDM